MTAGQKENEKKRKATQRRAERQQKKYSVDVATETPEQREIIGQPPLSKEEYMDSLKCIDK